MFGQHGDPEEWVEYIMVAVRSKKKIGGAPSARGESASKLAMHLLAGLAARADQSFTESGWGLVGLAWWGAELHQCTRVNHLC